MRKIREVLRLRLAHKHTSLPEHMPSSHRRYAEWTPARILREAGKIGPATIALFETIMRIKPHPEQGFRSCLGIIRLLKGYGPERIEAAAKRFLFASSLAPPVRSTAAEKIRLSAGTNDNASKLASIRRPPRQQRSDKGISIAQRCRNLGTRFLRGC